MCTKNFTYTKKFYVHKIAAVDLSKIYFLKNAMKACQSGNCDLNRDWMIKQAKSRKTREKKILKKFYLFFFI